MTPEILDALEAAQDLTAVGRVVRTAARTLTGAKGATFVLREHDHCFYADEDAIAPLWVGQRFPMTSCISGWARDLPRSVSPYSTCGGTVG